MAKRNFGWLTSAITAVAFGAADQQLIHESGAGKLGSLTPAQTQAGFAGVVTVGAGLTQLLARREGTLTNIANGAFLPGLAFLSQSGMHQLDRLMDQKATSSSTTGSTTTGSASGNADASADASITSSSADSTQDASAAITSSSDLADAFNG